MTEECTICELERRVPVLDKRIEQSPTAGNKYRTRCLACDAWGAMTSELAFRECGESLILPVDGDVDEPDDMVPVDEYRDSQDDGDDAPDPREPDEGQAATQRRAATDGGDDGGVDDDDDGDDDGDEAVNTFPCPACGEEQTGHPDNCADCGAAYNW